MFRGFADDSFDKILSIRSYDMPHFGLLPPDLVAYLYLPYSGMVEVECHVGTNHTTQNCRARHLFV
jgi:hypothetical protein